MAVLTGSVNRFERLEVFEGEIVRIVRVVFVRSAELAVLLFLLGLLLVRSLGFAMALGLVGLAMALAGPCGLAVTAAVTLAGPRRLSFARAPVGTASMSATRAIMEC